MNRILKTAVLASLCLLASEGSLAQAAREQLTEPKWEKLGEGAQVLKQWLGKGGLKEPQVAILKLSDEEYKEFDHDPTEYLKKFDVFGKNLTTLHAISRVDLSERKESEKKPKGSAQDPWIVIVVHNPYCTYATISFHIP